MCYITNGKLPVYVTLSPSLNCVSLVVYTKLFLLCRTIFVYDVSVGVCPESTQAFFSTMFFVLVITL